jgi:hypothetical protein
MDTEQKERRTIMLNILKNQNGMSIVGQGWEDHPFYAAFFDCSHIGAYVFTPDCSNASEH